MSRYRVGLFCLVALSSILVACAQGAPPPSGQPTGQQPAAQEQPKRGGILRNVLDRDPSSCDQGGNLGGDRVSGNACGGMLNGLLKWNTGDKIEPDLAEKWETTTDGKTWTFFLRKDVKWHDGKPFTADDVVFQFNKWLKPPKGINVTSPRAFQTYIDQVEKIDDYTVRFRMKFSPAAFLNSLADHGTFIYPKHVLEALDLPTTTSMKSVVGTGPFKYKQEVRGSIYEMERNPNYFREGLPYLDGVRYTVLPDPSTRLAAITTNQLDVYSGAEVPPEDANTLKEGANKDRIKVQALYNLNYQYVALNMLAPPLTDPKVREAVWRVIDQREAVRVLGLGDGVVGYRMFTNGKWSLPKEELDKLPGMGPRDQELAKAKQLLADAGYPNGFTLEKSIHTRNVTRDQDLGVWVAQQLGQIGIKAQTKAMESAALDQVMTNKDFQIRASYSTMRLDDPDIGFIDYRCDERTNLIGLCDKDYDAKYLAQTGTIDPVKRKELALDMQRILAKTNAYVPVFWVAFNVAQWDYVRGWNPVATNKWCYCMIVFDTAWMAK